MVVVVVVVVLVGVVEEEVEGREEEDEVGVACGCFVLLLFFGALSFLLVVSGLPSLSLFSRFFCVPPDSFVIIKENKRR